MEAVKQGSATVGLKNKTHAVLIALKRASSELSAYQEKIIPIDNHMGITLAGLTADARMLRFFDSKNFVLKNIQFYFAVYKPGILFLQPIYAN